MLILSGCSTGAANWTKPSLDASRRADDFASCQDDTRLATQREYAIDQDITASRGFDWHNQGVFNQQRSNLTNSDSAKSDQLLSACMMSMGYEPAK